MSTDSRPVYPRFASTIDTGSSDGPVATSAIVDDGQRVNLRDRTRAERFSRRILENVWTVESVEDLDRYQAAESLMLDALLRDHPDLMATLQDAIETQRACLPRFASSADADPQPAVPATPLAHSGNTTKETRMFDIDTGSSGSEGPWLAWSARGTQDGLIPPQSFYIRDTNGKTKFDGFTSGVVFDVHNMKTGWQRSEGIAGQPPDWRWNKTLARIEAAPGEDYKKGFSIRIAIGDGLTVTWEQAGAAVWNAFRELVRQLKAAPSADMLPVIKLTGTKAQKFARGSTVEPVLTVVKWVPRPDCLAEGSVATDPLPQSGAAVRQTGTKAEAPARDKGPDDADFDDDIPF